MPPTLRERAAVHAALAEPVRLAIVDELARSDRSPAELGRRLGIPGNLMAHHLDTLERAGLVVRTTSSGDRRRRYVHLRPDPVAAGRPTPAPLPRSVLFVCTHNSARSPLAAAAWQRWTGARAASAGTSPADAVHPEAVRAADRAGLDLHGIVPRHVAQAEPSEVVVTVCDRAHEQLDVDDTWWHWSMVDPAEDGTSAAFEATLAELDVRIRALVGQVAA